MSYSPEQILTAVRRHHPDRRPEAARRALAQLAGSEFLDEHLRGQLLAIADGLTPLVVPTRTASKPPRKRP